MIEMERRKARAKRLLRVRPLMAAGGMTTLAAMIAFGVPAQSAPSRCAGLKTCESVQRDIPVDPALPSYTPKSAISGKLRIYGSPLGGQVDAWVAGFKKYQPNVQFENAFPSSDAAAGGLIVSDVDIASTGREAMLSEFLAFYEVLQYDLLEVAVASGTYDTRGRTPSVVVYVNKDNPLTQLTVDQLDGIFGSERTGGYDGYIWKTEYARGPEKNIRTWDQLGLTGEWANKPIQTHGYAFTGMTNYFQRVVLKGGDKWAPNYKEYTESFTKMVPHGDYGPGSSQYMLEQVAQDKYAIAWSFIPQQERMKNGTVKALKIGVQPGGPYYAPNLENSLTRAYPLTRSVFFYLKKPPQGVDPKVQEFMRYVMSKQGQEDVAKLGVYLPLPADAAAKELEKVL